MAVNTIQHKQNRTTDSSREPSMAIWADCPVAELQTNPGKGVYFFDDFVDLPLAPTLTTQIAFGKYKAFADSGCTISKLSVFNSAEVLFGGASMSIDTDNDGVSLAHAYPSFRMSGVPGTDGKLWFECCYVQNSIATNMASGFIGLAEVEQLTLSSTVPYNDADTVSNAGSLIGFSILEDSVGAVDFGYSDRGTSITVTHDDVTTLVANTFVKLGFIYDPERTTDCIRVFINNVESSTVIARSTLTGLTNLDANGLGLLWAHNADSAGTSFVSGMKWWRIAQLAP